MSEQNKKLLQEAFVEALETEDVLANTTDNADEEISQAMAHYLDQRDADLKLSQIHDYIRERTVVQDELLKETFEKSIENADPEERTDQEAIEAKMLKQFHEHEEAIRKRRIHLYVREQIARIEAARKNKE